LQPIFLALVLLDHIQHALQRGCDIAHAQMRCHPKTKSKVRPKKNTPHQGNLYVCNFIM